MEFIIEWWNMCKEILEANYDETALNVLLWKHKAKHSLCLYDCFYTTYSSYMQNDFIDDGKPYIYMTFHGEKNIEGAEKIFDTIIDRKDGYNKEDYLNRNCCPNFGKASSYHPFICEY